MSGIYGIPPNKEEKRRIAEEDVLSTLDACVDAVASQISDHVKKPGQLSRRRKLPAGTLMRLMLGFHGNSLNAELVKAYPDPATRPSASAVVQARDKLCESAFREVQSIFNDTDSRQLGSKSVLGIGKCDYDILATDGVKISIPGSDESAFKYDSERTRMSGDPVKRVCQVHANYLFDVLRHSFVDVSFKTRAQSDERAGLLELVGRYPCDKPTIILGDRGYMSLNVVETLNRLPNMHYAIRAVAHGPGALKEIDALPDRPMDVDICVHVVTSSSYYMRHKDEIPNLHRLYPRSRARRGGSSKGNNRCGRWDFENHAEVRFRAVKVRINPPGSGNPEWEVIVTDLDRLEFSADNLKKLYHLRWDIETAFRDLKYPLAGLSLHTRKDDETVKELLCSTIMYNVARRVADLASHRAKRPKGDTKYEYRIDVKMACTLTLDEYRMGHARAPDRLLENVASFLQPVRPGRSDERHLQSRPPVFFVYRAA